MKLLGLTGSIGMGKTTAASLFRNAGVPVHDSDKVVHRLYTEDAIGQIEKIFPTVVKNGRVDRRSLASIIIKDPFALNKVENIIHPLVARDRDGFIDACRHTGANLAVLDIPLLFETGSDSRVDVIVTVTAPYAVQKERVLARLGMTEAKFELLLSRQMSDADKRVRSHYVIDTRFGYDWVNAEIRSLLRTLSG